MECECWGEEDRLPLALWPWPVGKTVDLSVRAVSAHLLPVILRNCIKDHCRKDSPTEGKDKPGSIVPVHHLHVRPDPCLEVSACSYPAWKECGWPLPPGVAAGCSPDKDPRISFLHNERAFGFTRSGSSSCIFQFLVPSHPSHPLNGLGILSATSPRGIWEASVGSSLD